jgi:hypothetical protein
MGETGMTEDDDLIFELAEDMASSIEPAIADSNTVDEKQTPQKLFPLQVYFSQPENFEPFRSKLVQLGWITEANKWREEIANSSYIKGVQAFLHENNIIQGKPRTIAKAFRDTFDLSLAASSIGRWNDRPCDLTTAHLINREFSFLREAKN